MNLTDGITPYQLQTISTMSLCSWGGWLRTTAPGSAGWPSANRAIYIPVRISRTVTYSNAFVANGATASGNWAVGIYSFEGTSNAVRLASTGSTAQSGTSVNQLAALTASVTLVPGLYYLACAMDGTTGTVIRTNSFTVEVLRGLGGFVQASAFALPATATLATYVGTVWPLFGLTQRSVV